MEDLLVLAATEESLAHPGRLDADGDELPPVPSWGRVDENGRLWVPLGMGAPEGWEFRGSQFEHSTPPAIVALPLMSQPSAPIGARVQLQLASNVSTMRVNDLRLASGVEEDQDEPGFLVVRVALEGDWYRFATRRDQMPTEVYEATGIFVEVAVSQPPRVERHEVDAAVNDDAVRTGLASHPNAWMTRTREAEDASPLLRRPVPAQDVVHLLGRRVLVEDDDGWVSDMRAISEPTWSEGEPVCWVVPEAAWYDWPTARKQVRRQPLHRVWVES